MKIYTLLFVPVLIVVFSCNNDSPHESPAPAPACGVDKPLEDLPWLKENIQIHSDNEFAVYTYIVQGKYSGQDVFLVGNCCPHCDSRPVIFNCQGDEIELESGGDIENQIVIWQHENTQCVL
jgi:hypothetical protein